MKKVLFALFALLSAQLSFAQIEAPQPSPSGTITQKVGLTDVKIEYSRPGVKGRAIFGDLVPHGELWRTGANACTKITFSDDAMFYGNKLPKGTYALFAIPGKEEWTIIFNKQIDLWGSDGHKQEEDVFRFNVKPMALRDKVETLTFEIANVTNNGADIALAWENTKVPFSFTVDTDSKVMADIETKINGPSASTYYQSARYYFDTKRDLGQALTWINKAIEKGEKYWIVRQKALIQASMGDYKGAIATAQRSIELAKLDDDANYVRMNEKSIAEWKTKL